MKRAFVFGLFISCLLAIALVALSDAAGGLATDRAQPLSNWRTFEKPDPFRADRYNARHPMKPFRFEAIADATDRRILAGGSILVLVNSTLYSSIEDDLSVYEQDLITAGYGVAFATAEGGTQQQIRALLQGYYNTWGASFRGCLLVGDLPIPWFQHFNDWDGYEDVFACDLYYADMDGVWTDTDSDGLLDSHKNGSGDTRPEIWIGRVTAHDMCDDEITLVKRFFADNHQYRLGNRNLSERALLYQDDDWATSPYWYYAFAALIDDRYWISDTDTTNASDYKSRFDDGYQWLLVCSHSDPSFNSFDTSWGTTYCYWDEVRDGNPNFNFSITFACSNADYSCSDYMSGWYLLAGSYTQLVLGTTKTGGFWYGDEFFDSLANRDSLGDSYNNWLSAEYPYDDTDISWWYGLTLLGDPSLYCGDMAADYYVDADAGDDANDGSEGSPWRTITHALDWIASNNPGSQGNAHTIHAAPGTFAASTNGETFPLNMQSWVSLAGGEAETTILDAEEGAYHVIRCEEVNNLTIADFTITGGYADGSSWPDDCGGGIYCWESSPTIQNNTITGNMAGYSGAGVSCDNSQPVVSANQIAGNSGPLFGAGLYCINNSSPRIEDNTIMGNSTTSYGEGGGIYCKDSSPTVIRNSISDNSSGQGGAVCCYNSSPIIQDNTIASNAALSTGGGGSGIFCHESSPTILGNTIEQNSGAYGSDGGGIYCCYYSSPTIQNNTISENSAVGAWGGGIVIWHYSSPRIQNNLITANSADGDGGGIWCETNCCPSIENTTISGNTARHGGAIACLGENSPTIRDSILWGNSPDQVYLANSSITITYSDVEGGWEGEGNIDDDPLFVERYYLSQTAAGQGDQSPCVDAGDDDASEYGLDTYTTRTDQVPDSGLVDMGYHYEREVSDPQLSDPRYSPQSGRTDTEFTFTVHYYHSEGQAPSRIQVLVNDAPHDMTLDSGSAADGIYAWTGLIPEAGRVQYHFEAEDSYGRFAICLRR